MLSLLCCAGAFPSCVKQGLLSSCGVRASHCSTWALECAGSVVVEHGLRCPKACGILPNQGLNSCPLNWQTDA